MAMQVKRYEAPSLRHAFQQIKSDLGPDAVIVHSQPLRRSGWRRFFGGPRFEVIAAVDKQGFSLAEAGGAASEERRLLQEMQQSLAEMRTQLSLLSPPSCGAGPAWKSAPLAQLHQRLTSQEVEPELASDLVREVEQSLASAQQSSATAVWAQARAALENRLRVSGPLRLAAGRPRIVVMAGPTGVGKTTTVAKLAANFALSAGGGVALITTDTFRVAAIPQLRTYGDIIGVPTEVAYTPAELSALVERHADKSLILVDMPGRSQGHAEHLRDLAELVRALPQPTVLLALAASTRYADLLHAVEAYSCLPLSGLLFTKLDETSSYGALVNLPARTGKPLTYLTAGQNVPQDIDLASAAEVARLVLEGGAA